MSFKGIILLLQLAAALSLLLVSAPAFAQKMEATAFTQNLTGSAPTLGTDGVSLAGATHYQVTVSAASGQTLSGAGTLTCYYYGAVDGSGTRRWFPCDSTLNVAVNKSGQRDMTSLQFPVGIPSGRLMYVTSGVTVSGGTTVVVTIEVRRIGT
jgi:hypothetical protein